MDINEIKDQIEAHRAATLTEPLTRKTTEEEAKLVLTGPKCSYEVRSDDSDIIVRGGTKGKLGIKYRFTTHEFFMLFTALWEYMTMIGYTYDSPEGTKALETTMNPVPDPTVIPAKAGTQDEDPTVIPAQAGTQDKDPDNKE